MARPVYVPGPRLAPGTIDRRCIVTGTAPVRQNEKLHFADVTARDLLEAIWQPLKCGGVSIARLLGSAGRGGDCGRSRGTGHTEQSHRSTSPNTMSSEPRIADTSASMYPLQRKSIAWRCAKPGARIWHL
jgi:hypothetical protein